MATEKTDSPVDENRDEATDDSMAISERTVTTEHMSPAELRCGITLLDEIEAAKRRQSSGSDDRSE